MPQTSRAAPPPWRPLTGVALFVYNIFYWPYLLSTCSVLFFPAFAIWLVTFTWDKKLAILHRYTSYWAAHYLAWAPFAGVHVTGKERVPKEGGVVFVSNHQSMVDILAVFATHLHYKWVSKIENFYVPFLGWAMVLNRYVALKRGRLPSIMRMVRRSHALLRAGDRLFIFPEGTRSPTGELISFFSGAFRLSVRNDVPIVPVIIEGTFDILPKSKFRISPRPVEVSILDPIYPSDHGRSHKRMHDEVRARMAAEIDRLRGRPSKAQ